MFKKHLQKKTLIHIHIITFSSTEIQFHHSVTKEAIC